MTTKIGSNETSLSRIRFLKRAQDIGTNHMDSTATLCSLKTLVQTFCEIREWDQYHGPKDLAIGIITEASELLEHFRFLNEDQADQLLREENKRLALEGELSDVLFFVLRFAQRFEIDLDDALRRKVEKNKERYPVNKSRGSNLKYDELS